MTATRLTRAKAAAAGGLQPASLENNNPANNNNVQRKRAALGDLSTNANKEQLKSQSNKLVSMNGGSSNNNNRKATASGAVSSRQPLGQKTTNREPATTKHTSSAKTNIAVYDESNTNTKKTNNNKPTHKLDSDNVVDKEADLRALKKPKTATSSASDSSTPEWDDLDKEDADDPLMVSEYVVEIFDFLYNMQEKYMPNPNYMDDQKHLEWEMRGVLVDWLVEVHCKFRLLPETLFLAINIVDRFMSARVVSLNKVQLVGIAALFVAAKYEEVFTPAIQNYAYISDGGYEEDDILNAERFVLQVLGFDMCYPNPMNFLRRISKADNYDIQSRTIGKYLLEISLLDYRLLKFLPSENAAAAMYLSRKILSRKPEWTPNLIHYSGNCNEEKLNPIITIMIDYLASPVIHDGFFKKYASKRFLKASIIARQWAKDHVHEYPLQPQEQNNS